MTTAAATREAHRRPNGQFGEWGRQRPRLQRLPDSPTRVTLDDWEADGPDGPLHEHMWITAWDAAAKQLHHLGYGPDSPAIDATMCAEQAMNDFARRLHKQKLLTEYMGSGGAPDDPRLVADVAEPYYGDEWPRYIAALRRDAADPRYNGPILNPSADIAVRAKGYATRVTLPANSANTAALKRLDALIHQTPGATFDSERVAALAKQVRDDILAENEAARAANPSARPKAPSADFHLDYRRRRRDAPVTFDQESANGEVRSQDPIRAASEDPVGDWIDGAGQPSLDPTWADADLNDACATAACRCEEARERLRQNQRDYDNARSHHSKGARDQGAMKAATTARAGIQAHAARCETDAARLYAVFILATSRAWDGQPSVLPRRASMPHHDAETAADTIRAVGAERLCDAWDQQSDDCGEPLFAAFGGLQSPGNPDGVTPDQADGIVAALRGLRAPNGGTGLATHVARNWVWWADDGNADDMRRLLGLPPVAVPA